MKGAWFKICENGRRFILKISQGENIHESLKNFAKEADVKNAMLVSAVGSVTDVRFRGIKTGATLPLTNARMTIHQMAGPLELLGLSGNIFPDENDEADVHLHTMVSKASGEVFGGHLFDAKVFASCELVVTEIIVSGIERHLSKSAGTTTIFIEEK
jgi:hypothetical protein